MFSSRSVVSFSDFFPYEAFFGRVLAIVNYKRFKQILGIEQSKFLRIFKAAASLLVR